MLLRLVHAAPGVRIFLDTPVRAVQPDLTVTGGLSVTLARTEVPHVDIIIDADGINSTFSFSFFFFANFLFCSPVTALYHPCRLTQPPSPSSPHQAPLTDRNGNDVW